MVRQPDNSRYARRDEFPINTIKTAKKHSFGVIESGFRLSTEGIQAALTELRLNVPRGGLRPKFKHGMFLSGLNLGAIKTNSSNTDDFEITRQFIVEGLNNLFISIFSNTQGVPQKWNPVQLRPDLPKTPRVLLPRKIVKCLAKELPIFYTQNGEIWHALDDLFDPDVFKASTMQQFSFVSPECLADVMREVEAILAKIEIRPIAHALAKYTDVDWGLDEASMMTVFREALTCGIKSGIGVVSNVNGSNMTKMRVWTAGGTLANILTAHVSITPIVREAAVRTLRNIIDNIPPPPDFDPPNVKRVVVGKG